jgi:hypothetical protein
MKTQAWGWLAAAVLAAGLNASYHDGGLRWAHRIADQIGHNTNAVLALATGRADQFLTEARFVASPQELTPCRFAVAMERAQGRMAVANAGFDRFHAMSDRQVAQLQRFEASRIQMQAQLAAMRIPAVELNPVVVRTPRVVCPRLRVSLPKPPLVHMPAVPEIHIDASGTGPV